MGNFIHPTSIIESGAIIGDNNYIGPFCYISSKTKIGSNNRFEGFCSIGTAPEYYSEKVDTTSVQIGDNNIFREGVIITCGTNLTTTIGNNVKLLSKTSIAHDCYIEDNVICSAGITLAGFVYIMKGVNIGMNVSIHQNSIIGAYSMLGMGTIVTKKSNIEPGNIYIGSPARFLRKNEIGLSRGNIDENKLLELKTIYNSKKTHA